MLDLITFDSNEVGLKKDDGVEQRAQVSDEFNALHSRHHSTKPRDSPQRLFQMNLKTEILTVMDKIKIAFLVDSNFSMKTGDHRIHSSVAYETICKTINGLMRTFQFTNSINGEQVELIPKILVSVVAENQESDFIPMRSYLHNQEISEGNMMSVFESLYLEMIKHETDLISLQVKNLLIGQI